MRHSPTLGAIIKGWRLFSVRAAALVLVVLMCSGGAFAYSVLTHEEIVDLLWTDEIRPLLLKRYPGLSEDQIREAHAYADGGAVIQAPIETKKDEVRWQGVLTSLGQLKSVTPNATVADRSCTALPN